MKTEPFRIYAYLPANRWNAGELRLFNPNGAILLDAVPCRGKADGEHAARAKNPDRDPTQKYGDTPAGLYRPSRITRFDPHHKTMGPLAIWLEGQTGDALKAVQQGRTGLAIHGGRGDEKLMATYGCLRVFDRDMAQLADLIGDAPVIVEIFNAEELEKS